MQPIRPRVPPAPTPPGRRPSRRRRSGAPWRAVLLLLLAAAGGCGAPRRPAEAPPAGPTLPDGTDGARWVRIYDPVRAASGYNLDFYRARLPVLFDMNGRVVHAWPMARAKSRLRLLPDGSLLAIGLARSVVEYDWDGRLVWRHDFAGTLPHHDVVRLANGNTLVLTRRDGVPTDDLLEIERTGRVVWEWRSGEHLAAELHRRQGGQGDITHINSVQELPDNPWFRQGDERFRPGNLLISARNLNAVFVIDRRTGDVTWTYDRELDLQHEALMIGPGLPGHGNILLFDNGYRSWYRYRRSAVLEIAPRDGTLLWSFHRPGFYSPTAGVAQPLANGNVLITSSRGGRAFEVTRGGDIVWQWAPSGNPTRMSRYPYDYCPQLAALPPPTETAVEAAPGYRHVDPESYRFARRGKLRTVRVAGERLRVLAQPRHCQRLFLPAGARVEATFGLDRSRLAGAGIAAYAARFTLEVTPEGATGPVPLLDETVDLAAPAVVRRAVALDAFAHQEVELCVAVAAAGSAHGDEAGEAPGWWANPIIVGPDADGLEADDDDIDALGDLTPAEREAQQRHLKALGYVD